MHYVAAEDIGWLLELTAPRIRPVIVRQLVATHGLDGPRLDRATSVVLQTLAEQPDQSREQVAGSLHENGIEPRAPGDAPARLPRAGAAHRQRPPDRGGAHLRPLRRPRARPSAAGPPSRSATCAGASPTSGTGSPASSTTAAPSVTRRRPTVEAGPAPGGRETAIGIALVDAQIVARMKRTVGRRVAFEITPYDGTLTSAHRTALEPAAARHAEFLGLGVALRTS